MSGEFDVVAVIGRPWLRKFQYEVAKKLKSRKDASLYMYGTNTQDVQYYKKNDTDGIYSGFGLTESILPDAMRPVDDDQAVVAKARSYEQELGYSYNSLLLHNRHLGRGYALSGSRHPRSYQSEGASYIMALNAHNLFHEYWDREFKEKGITLILNPTPALAAFAKARGVGTAELVSARYKNFFYWTPDLRMYNERIRAAFRDLPAGSEGQPPEPQHSHLKGRVTFLKKVSLLGACRQALSMTARTTYARLRKYDKGRGYYLRDWIRYLFVRWIQTRQLTGKSVVSIDELKGKNFVFFPLQTDPETALQRVSPEFYSQLSAIAMIAQALPADTILVVKEHYEAVGRRPDGFYRQLREFKNVRLANMLELGINYVRDCRILATVGGSAGVEAASLGRPVISFGRHNTFRDLDHCRVVKESNDVAEAVDYFLSDKFDEEVAAADGKRYLAAIESVSYDMRDYNSFSPDRPISDETVLESVENLFETLTYYNNEVAEPTRKLATTNAADRAVSALAEGEHK